MDDSDESAPPKTQLPRHSHLLEGTQAHSFLELLVSSMQTREADPLGSLGSS